VGRRKQTLVASAAEQAKHAGAVAQETAKRAADAAGAFASELPLEPIAEQLQRYPKRRHRKHRRHPAHGVVAQASELAETIVPIATTAATVAVQQGRRARRKAKVTLQGTPPKKRRKGRVLLVLFLGAGIAAAIVLKRRAGSGTVDVAPDPFGKAVEAEREARGPNAQRPVATPGA
jgi:hypothetical protein